jgi:hypothetical protein
MARAQLIDRIERKFAAGSAGVVGLETACYKWIK